MLLSKLDADADAAEAGGRRGGGAEAEAERAPTAVRCSSFCRAYRTSAAARRALLST